MKSIETLNQKLNPLRHFKPKQKQLFRLGCAALALALAVGTVPFLRGWAANEQAVVSDSDSVSGTDTVITNSITVEPKPAKSMIGGINWQRLDSVDDLNNAALSSKSTITLGMVSNWVNNYLDAFAAENGYPDASKLGFISDRSSSDWITLTYRSQYGMQMVSSSINNYSNFSLFYIPRVPATGVIFSHTRLDLNVGDTETVTGELSPADTNDKIVWNSQDTTVVTIKENGTVTAVGCGSTTITATVYNDVYEIPVTVSGQSFVNLNELGISGWVLATSWEEIKNAAYIDSSSIKSWVSLQRRKYPTRKWVYKYDPETEEAYQRSTSSGSFTEETFATMSNVYYIPKLPSYTYHPAQPATCTQHATIAYWTDQDGNKFLNANTENPIDSIYDETSTLADHTFAWVTDTDPTCGADGVKHEECSVCGTKQNENTAIPATGEHTFAWVTDTAATCGADGVKHEECSVCHAKQNENTAIPATGEHTFAWVTDTESTCGADGVKHEECSVCHAKQNENTVIPATGEHTYAWVTDTAATCGADGIKHGECTVCHAKKNENTVIPATGEHTFAWVTDTAATCGADGVKHEECSVCHAKQNENTVIPATGEHTLAWVTDTEATCGADGVKHEECSVCHMKQNENTVIPATGEHTFAWVTDLEPTEIDPGEKHEECSVCHAKQNEHTEIPAQPDDYSFTDDSTFKGKKGSKDGLLMVIKNTSNPADDPATFEKLVAVYVDGNKLNPDTDYTAVSGSIRLTLLPGYLNKLSTGEHTLKVVLTVTTIEHAFTVTAPASTDAPSTGENGLTIAVSFVLLTFALAGCAFSFLRKRKAQT